MDSWRQDEDWERAGALLTAHMHHSAPSAASSTTEQQQDELQACPQAAALFTPAVPELRRHPPRRGVTGMDRGKGQLNLLPHCCQLQNASRTPRPDLFRVHKFL